MLGPPPPSRRGVGLQPEGRFWQPAGLGQTLGGRLPHSSAPSLLYLLQSFGSFSSFTSLTLHSLHPFPSSWLYPSLILPSPHPFRKLLFFSCLLPPYSLDSSPTHPHPPHPSPLSLLTACSLCLPAPWALPATSSLLLLYSIRSSLEKTSPGQLLGDSEYDHCH